MLKWFSHKSNGAALIYAVFIMFISVLIGTGLTLLYGFEKKQEKSIDFQDRVRRNVDSGLNLLLASNGDDFEDWTNIDLFNEEKDSVELKMISWGIFDIALCKSNYRNKHAQKSALIGSQRTINYSLYLAEMNQALSLGGDTKLKGTCFIPKKGLKRSNVENLPYQGNRLLYGTKKESKRELPRLNFRQFDEFFLIEENETDSIVYSSHVLREKLQRSFFESTTIIESSGNMLIHESELNGNVKILCGGDLTIDQDSKLNHVLIYCDKLYIEEGFEGSIQVFARDSVFIEDNVNLTYPSVVYAKQMNSGESAYIEFGEQCSFSGEVMVYEKQLKRDNWPNVLIKDESVFQGTIYCNGYLELKGSLLAGSGTALKSIYHGLSGSYENTFLNAEIDRGLLSDFFVSGVWHEPTKKKQICDMP